MLATKFKWQEEKDGGEPPWLYDGSSSMRQVPQNGQRRGLARHGKKLVFLIFLAAVVFALARIEIEEASRASGIIEPYQVSREHIKAPITGNIRQLSAREGDSVHEGQLLAVIWPDELDVLRDVENRQLDYEIALEEIKKVRENLETLAVKVARLERELELFLGDDSTVTALERRLSAAEMNYRQKTSDAVRARALFVQEVISAAEHERAVTAQELVAEEVLNLQAEIRALTNSRLIRREQLEREIELTRRQVSVEQIHLAQRSKEKEQQETMLEAARQRAEKMNIFAPWSGTVVRQEKSEGDRVAGGESIIILSANRGTQVSVRIRPEDFHRLAVGQKALIQPRSQVREPFDGEVSAIGSYARRDPESGGHYIPAWIIVTGKIDRPLPLGTVADVTIFTGERRGLLAR